MADTKAILSSDKSAAPAAALSLLCVLIAVQIFVGIRGLWPYRESSAAGSAVPGQPGAPGSVPAASSVSQFVIPPLPAFANPMPSAGSLPPLPFPAAPVPAPAASQAAMAPVYGNGAAVPAPARSMAPAEPPSSGAAKTGNPEVDELLKTARDLADLDEKGALEVINRADLMLPGNPIVMREKQALSQRVEKQEQDDQAPASAVHGPSSRISPPPPPVGRSPQPAPSPPVAPPPPGLPPQSSAEKLNRSFGQKPSAASAIDAALATSPEAAPAAFGGPLSLGACKIVRDNAIVRGERFDLKIPLIIAPGAHIDAAKVSSDVFFYDKVNDDGLALTMADKPGYAYDTAGDFRGGTEVLSVTFNMPEFTQTQIAQLGRHVYYGYIVKLYYNNHLVGSTASPAALAHINEPGSPLHAALAAGTLGLRN